MTYGEKISKLRKSKDMTQKELGDALNVTYQAVSKWERDESLPDFETMVRLSKLFGVSITYFEDSEAGLLETGSLEETEKDQTDENAQLAHDSAEPEETKAEMIGVCTTCGRILHEGEEEPNQPKLICKNCVAKEKRKAEQLQEEARNRKLREKAAVDDKYRKRTIWGCVVGGIVAVAVLIGSIVAVSKTSLGFDAVTIVGIIALPLIMFSWVFQLFWDGAVREVASWGLIAIKMPGVIFTADLDGLKFLIIMKILLAILSWIITAGLIFLAAFASMIVGIVSFVPLTIKIRRRNDDIMPI